MKKIINEFGQELIVDEVNQKLYDYDNSKKIITWNAEIIKNGIGTGSFTNYTEPGVITDLETRLRKWNNPILLAYTKFLNFTASEKDPNKEIWYFLVNKIKENEYCFFDQNGNFRKKFLLDPKVFLR